MLNEEWRPIEGFENLYEISNLGNVKRVFKAKSNLDRSSENKLLKINLSSKYPAVSLAKGGKSYFRILHRLIAKAFIPNPLNKATVNHKNANKLDWSLNNLEWATHSENLNHALSLGLNPMQGVTHHKAKLTPEQVLSFRNQWDGTQAWCNKKAAELGLDANTIRLAVTGKTWKSVEAVALPAKLVKSDKPKVTKKREEISYSQQKLKDEEVLQAREEYYSLIKKFGYISAKAEELGVDRKTLSKAIAGETFKHLPLSGRE